MKDNTSSMFKAERHLMFSKTEILKDKRLSPIEDTMVQIKDGSLFILIKLLRNQQLDSTENLDSISTDCSISDQECQ
jgi:hypothetical protein